MRLRRAHAHCLLLQRVAHVATATGPGVPHVAPRNLRANPYVAVSVDDYTEAWGSLRGVGVSGTARVHARNPMFRRIRPRLYAKYLQYPTEAALGDTDSVVVEITPRRVYAWGFD
ncbi:MAG: pyridoxamine 5'-phosphate oxidase family protein [Candidatus Rokubacteria bacterium]|nr:pyridoxamine 5'-phosphate oxidase family protein [Candidatus Rokubacteria bacterium]